MLTTKELNRLVKEENAILLDTREIVEFAEGFIPESIHFSFEKDHGWIQKLKDEQPMVVFIDWSKKLKDVDKSIEHHFKGQWQHYKTYPLELWQQEGNQQDMIITIEPDELAMDIPHDDQLLAVDIRSQEEFDAEHLKNAYSLPAEELADPGVIALVPEMANLYLYCNTGADSLYAASIFKNQGLHNVRVVLANWTEIRSQKGLSFEKTKPDTSQDQAGISLS